MDPPPKHEKIKLVEINSYLTCYLCKGYLIDATTISECLHSFCRSCIIKFLQENCYCPVCEVIINKAKPCLKLDKTLQDIVYKLVPELFVKEMYRRKVFYQSRPALWHKVSPEERGEDTERTIFNPQDAISLSIEYISDDSAPGAIPSLPLQKTQNNNNNNNKNGTQIEEPQDNPMKRYLQCPGMCRIDVLKKFVRNKYNVDTNLFHIDILYKRVPLPDHYTLIDIGYIYSWKRNEPMKFFFRITDINKVAERFDYFDGRTSPEIVHHQKPPTRIKHHSDREKNKTEKKNHKETTSHQNNNNKETKEETKPLSSVTVPKDEKKQPSAHHQKELNRKDGDEEKKKNGLQQQQQVVVDVKREKCTEPIKNEQVTNKKLKSEVKICGETSLINNNKDGDKRDESVIPKPEITEEMKSKIQSDIKNSVYTNITLNRDDNLEIITKIQKVSNKEGHPIGLNIINHTVKKANKVQSSSNNKNQRVNNNATTNNNKSVPTNVNEKTSTTSSNTTIIGKKPEEVKTILKTEESKDREREELEKSNFLKSIELTAKNPMKLSPKSTTTTSTPVVNNQITTTSPKPVPTTSTSSFSASSSSAKRKNSSPVKNDKIHQQQQQNENNKKVKIEKKPVKIIIQPKSIANPAVRQMVSNVNQNANNMSKIVEQSSTAKAADLQTLIDNCKIPASLSITLNEGGEGGARTPPSIPPVKNYIEILKLPDNKTEDNKNNNNNKEEKKTPPTTPLASNNKDNTKSIPSFQKIFEESIIKKASPSVLNNNNNNKSKPSPIDLSSESPTSTTPGSKRKILEIASQLQKKTKIEQEKNKSKVEEGLSGKIAIPRLATQRTLKPVTSKHEPSRPQTSASLHSSTLGMNYTVSVGGGESKSGGGGGSPEAVKKSPSTSKTAKNNGSSPSGAAVAATSNNNKGLSPNQLLEKYNIQNLAQLTAGFNFNPPGFGVGGGLNTALQHAMLLKQIEHQSWLNQGPLLQYEKYLQTLSATQNKIMGNIKEN